MNEQDLNKILGECIADDLNVETEKRFQSKVKSSMNRFLYGRVLLSIVCVALLAAGLYFGSSKMLDLMYYRPEKEPAFLVQTDWQSEEFAVLLEDTISTYFPGKYCWVLAEPKAHGFGRYTVDLKITDAYGPNGFLSPATDQAAIGFSKLDMGYAPLYAQAVEFIDPELSDTTTPEERGFEDPLLIRQELQSLPRSAYLDISISFPSAITSEEAARIINTASDIRVRWLALEGQDTTKYNFAAGGMFVDHLRREEMTEEAAEKYPDYYLPEKVTGESLERCLQSRLQLLIDHPEFVSLMQTQFGNMISMPMLKQRLQNAQERWACYGMRLVGNPDEILKLMDELSATYAKINDVKVSRFEK